MSEIETIQRLQMEGVFHPSQTPNLIGHQSAQASMVSAHAQGQLHHAWLITGAEGIGKATLAFHFAKHLIALADAQGDGLFPQPEESGFIQLSQDNSIFRQVANGSHPSLLYLARPWDQKAKRFKTQLTVETIRQTVGFFGATAMNNGWRIAIVDAADDMNKSAANALLKILEEPPKRSIFLILSHSPGKLLPTIRSRCRHLPLKPLAFDEIKQILAMQEGFTLPDGEDLERVANLSEGSARRALQLCSGDALSAYQNFVEICQNNEPQWSKIHLLSEQLTKSGNEEAYALFFDMINGFLARRVRGENEPIPHNQSGLFIGGNFPLAHWADLWENLQQARAISDGFNLDKKQVILSFFQSLFCPK